MKRTRIELDKLLQNDWRSLGFNSMRRRQNLSPLTKRLQPKELNKRHSISWDLRSTGHYPPCLSFSPVERKSQEIECLLFNSLGCSLFVKGDKFCLLLIELKPKLLQSFCKSLSNSIRVRFILTAYHRIVSVAK